MDNGGAMTLERLRQLTLEAMPEEGRIETPLPGLALTRFNSPQESRQCFYDPMFALVMSGKKLSMIGGKSFSYSAGEAALVTLDLPGAFQIQEASPEAPFLSLSIRLDRALVTELLAEAPELRLCADLRDSHETAVVTNVSEELLDALCRYLALMKNRRRAAVLGPLIFKEIHFLLLDGPEGRLLADICSDAAPNARILKAVRWLRGHYAESVDVATLAERAAMAPSTFHRQFRAVTSLSPVQYQKHLRLIEAKRLMLAESLTVEAAARQVGYESPSQFSREYKRLFGEAPRRDILDRRLQVQT